MTAPFVHLRVHSDFSLSQGTSKVGDLVKRVAALRQPAMALTDVRNLHAALEITKYAAKEGIQPITGAQVSFVTHAAKKAHGTLLLLAQNAKGYANICKLVDMSLARGRQPEGTIDTVALKAIFASLSTSSPLTAGIIAVTGVGAEGVLDSIFGYGGNDGDAAAVLQLFKNAFPNRFYLEICRNGYPSTREIENERRALKLALSLNIPIVGTTDVWYATDDRHDAWEILRAVGRGGDTRLEVDEEGLQIKSPRRYCLRSNEEMAEIFSDLPEAYENTSAIAKRCAFQAGKRAPILPPFDTGAGRSEAEELRIQAREGLEMRLRQIQAPAERHQEYQDRLEFELGVIEKMGFPGYFLIVSDFIKFAKNNGIPVGPGRGSGAGSVVAWSLTITDLDPLRFGLLFERFLNPDRVSMPDFDVDFCQDRREEVIHYVKNKYGEDKVAMIATFMEIKSKTAIRDVARVINTPTGALPQMVINGIADLIPPSEDTPADPAKLKDAYRMSETFRASIDNPQYPANRMVYDNALKIEGLFRNSSSHAAGIIIAGDSLTNLVPVGYDANADMPQVQLNMKDAEAAGLVKFDFLGLKTLSVIRETIEHIRSTTGEVIDLSTLPYEDAPTYQMLAKGHSNGVFQLESDGMKRVLRDIKPTQIEDLIAVVSLYRPGPMEMIPTYARRKNGLEQPEYPEPADQTSRFLGETYGIMVYQEQVMQVAQVVAGYSLGGADLLRRAMGKKIKSEMDAQKEQFIAGAEKNGTPKQKAAELFDLIEKFSGYGFNKSHAAAYAVIAFHTAWLKRHYPAQFFAALMTYETSKPEKLALIKQDMDRFQIELLPPDVNSSHTRFKPERKADGSWSVRMGLTAIKGVTENIVGMIETREQVGLFKSLEDFHQRAGEHLSSSQLQKLSEAGAFDSISPGGVRQRAFSILTFLAKADRAKKDKHTQDMFAGDAAPVVIPAEELRRPEWENLTDREFGAVGFFFREHPLDRRLKRLERIGGVREKAKIVKVMTENRWDVMETMKVAGMVEFVDKRTWSDGGARLDIKISERHETYFVGMSSPAKAVQSIDEMYNILFNAKTRRLPVVLVCDVVQNDRGTRLYCREAIGADEYLARCATDNTIEVIIDPRRLPLSEQERETLDGIYRQATQAGLDRNAVTRAINDIIAPHYRNLHHHLVDILEKYQVEDGSGQSIVLMVDYQVGGHGWRKLMTLPAKFRLTPVELQVIKTKRGVASVGAVDEQQQTEAA